MSGTTSNVVSQHEMELATSVMQSIVVGGMSQKIAVLPAELAGVRVMTLVADMNGVDDEGGFLPVAVVVNSRILEMLHPAEGKVTLEGQEGVA